MTCHSIRRRHVHGTLTAPCIADKNRRRSVATGAVTKHSFFVFTASLVNGTGLISAALVAQIPAAADSTPLNRFSHLHLAILHLPFTCRPRLIRTQNIIHTSGDFSADNLIGGRKMLVDRHLQGIDRNTTLSGSDVTINNATNVYSQVGKYCPDNNATWGSGDNYNSVGQMYSRYGDFVHDAGICSVAGDGVGKVVTSNSASGVVSLCASAN